MKKKILVLVTAILIGLGYNVNSQFSSYEVSGEYIVNHSEDNLGPMD
ncbi:hypothetical protein RZN25_18330 [Bacillaceae bacterium S4-13-56]